MRRFNRYSELYRNRFRYCSMEYPKRTNNLVLYDHPKGYQNASASPQVIPHLSNAGTYVIRFRKTPGVGSSCSTFMLISASSYQSFLLPVMQVPLNYWHVMYSTPLLQQMFLLLERAMEPGKRTQHGGNFQSESQYFFSFRLY